MVSQKMISVKLDVDQLELLDVTCSNLGINRNKFINFLVYFANIQLKQSKNMALLSAYMKCLSEF